MDRAEQDKLRAEYIQKTLARVRQLYGPEVKRRAFCSDTKEEQPRIEVNGIKMRCPECGEYMVHGYVSELEAFTFMCKRCNIAAQPKPLTPSDFGFDIEPWSCGDEGGWKHSMESGEQDELS